MFKKIMTLIGLIALSIMLYMDSTERENLEIKYDRGYIVQHAGNESETVFSKVFILEPGTYHVKIGYTSSEEQNYFQVKNYGQVIDTIYFPKAEGCFEYTLILKEETMQLEMLVYYNGSGYLEIKDFVMETEQKWYHDSWLRVVGLWLFVLAITVSKKKISQVESIKKRIFDLWVVAGIAVLASSLFFSSSGLGIGDDMKYHLTRIDGIANGLRDGQFPVMIYPNAVSGNGYLNVMYPSFFLYIPAVLRLLGVSLITSYKVLLVLMNFATAYATYYSMKCMNASRKATLLATILYVFMRYRLNNILVRSAVGESLALVFLPLVLAGLYNIIYGIRKKWWVLVIGATGVLQSHVLSTCIYAFIALILVLANIKIVYQEKRYVELLKATVATSLLNLWYVVPFIVFIMKGNLDLGELGRDVSVSSLNVSYLFGFFSIYAKDNNIVGRDYSLRFPIVAMLGISIMYMVMQKWENKRDKIFSVTSVGIGCIFIYMASNWFPYQYLCQNELLNKVFENIQFPWRLIGIGAGIIIMMGSIWLTEWNMMKNCVNSICIVLAFCAVMDTAQWDLQWNQSITGKNKGYSQCETIVLDKICQDYVLYPPEYYVIGNHMFSEHYKCSHEDVKILDYQKEKLQINCTYKTENIVSEERSIQFPLLNYLGYYAVDENGEKMDLYTNQEGTINIDIITDGEVHQVYIEYREPVLFRISELISVMYVIGCTLFKVKRKVYLGNKKINER